MESTRHFGKLVRNLRESKRLTLKYVAEKARMSIKGLEKIELGDSNPKLSTVVGIANVLGLDIGVLNICTASLPAEDYDGVMAVLEEYSDMSTDFESVAELVRLCNSLELSRCHLGDVVEDFLAAGGEIKSFELALR